MICNLEINKRIEDNKNILKILNSENLNFKRAKARFEIKETKLIIRIESKDTIAMKTILNTILKIIETYEKAK